jgi:hypothetical protein
MLTPEDSAKSSLMPSRSDLGRTPRSAADAYVGSPYFDDSAKRFPSWSLNTDDVPHDALVGGC